MHTYYSLLLPGIIYQYSSIDFTTYVKSTGGAGHFLWLRTTASDLGILTTTVSCITRYKSMSSANGGNYAGQYPCNGWVDNYNLPPHHRSVEHPSWFHLPWTRWKVQNAEQYAYRKISTGSSDATTLVACAFPPFCFGSKLLRTLPNDKREIMYCTGMDYLHAPLRKHCLSVHAKYLLWVFVNYVPRFRALFFSSTKN